MMMTETEVVNALQPGCVYVERRKLCGTHLKESVRMTTGQPNDAWLLHPKLRAANSLLAAVRRSAH